MAGWNLPPGCTDADVDRAMGGAEPRCCACGSEEELEEVWYRGQRLMCSRCAAHLEDDDEV